MPTFRDIMSARKVLDGYIYETPIIYSNALQDKTGHHQVVFKCENLQRTGSCHLRAMAYRVIRTKERDLGVNNFVTHSTGNCGAALACAAMQFQSTAHVVVPEGTSELITRSIKHYMGDYYFSKATKEGRLAKTRQLMEQYNSDEDGKHNHAVLVHPYDDDDVIVGHGTAGIELMLQTDCSIDCVIVPVCAGGALLAGIAMAVKGMKPHVAVFGAEPTDPDNGFQSFKRGELGVLKDAGHPRRRSGVGPRNFQTETNGTLTPLAPRIEAYVNKFVDGIIRVSEYEVRYAFRYVYERCKLVVDTNAAMAVAALMACRPEMRKYRRVGIILSGGNIDLNDIPKLAVAHL